MTARPPIAVERFKVLDSTSLHARRVIALSPPAEPVLYVAQEQTGGVGRFARPWASPRGGLWCTLLWPLAGDRLERERTIDGLGLRVGVACLDAVEKSLGPEAMGLDVRLKWPNDVLINDKKVLGVLCEIVTHAHPPNPAFALVGVGVNANLDPADLPERIRLTATTLRSAAGRDTDLENLGAALTGHLAAALTARGLDAAVLARARAALARIDRPVRVTLPDRTSIEGVLTGLSDDGRPVLQTPGGRVTLPSGAELL